ncbi:MAG: aspartate-semialdehyde dehydrogenase [bacterium]|nr:aspartate-semialdehyde dehydrogenase [bacterium]
MPDLPRVAVVGATGAVGRTMIAILEEREFPVSELRLMASERSAGTVVNTRWGEVTVEQLDKADPSGIDIALFSAGAARSRRYAAAFTAAGAVVVDNSSAFRQDPGVPLVVAGVNGHAVASHEGVIANPNCTTMTLMMAAGPLHRQAGLARMVAMSYQSVSGAGMSGMDALMHQSRVLIEQREALVAGTWEDPGNEPFQRQIGFNVLPMAGSITGAGHTDEEWKLVNETRKILEREDISVEPTCVRVPVMVGHGISATMWFDTPLDPETARRVIEEAPGVALWADDHVATPLDSAGADPVLVSRIRPTLGQPGGISLWTVGDNLRKGAALNAVEIAELLVA